MRLRLPVVAAVAILLTCVAASGQQRNKVVCRTAYDQDYFYLAAVVTKPNVVGSQTAPFTDPVKDDAVAVFLQAPGEPVTSSRTKRSVEMAVSAAGGAQLYRGSAATPLKGFDDILTGPGGAPIPFKFAVQVQGQINQPGDRESGYTVEMAIPWVELGGAPSSGQVYRFNVVTYSAGAGSAPVASLAPGVVSAAGVQDPSLWGELVFVEAPVRTVASAPNARVCSRVFNQPPLVDGTISNSEWSNLTSFGYSQADGAATTTEVQTSSSAARSRAKLEPHPATQRGTAAARILPPIVEARTRQTVGPFVMASYRLDWQGDTRKSLPYTPAMDERSATRLASHPLDGTGPWMTYDRVDWHRVQLERARTAGVDALLVQVPAGEGASNGPARVGLQALAAAARWLQAQGRDYPSLAPSIEVPSVPTAGGEDQTTRLYSVVRSFYLAVQPSLRSAIWLSPANGGLPGYLVHLRGLSADSALTGNGLIELRRRFSAEFGGDLVLMADAPAKGAAGVDLLLPSLGDRLWAIDRSGWLPVVSLSAGATPGSAMPAGAQGPLFARRPDLYREAWRAVVGQKPSLVVLSSWNDYQAATEIAPTAEYGQGYADVTAAWSAALAAQDRLFAAILVAHDLPSTAPAGAKTRVLVRLRNTGTMPWAPDVVALSGTWDGKRHEPAVGLTTVVEPGAAVSVYLPVTVPADAGTHAFEIELSVTAKGKGTGNKVSFAVCTRVDQAGVGGAALLWTDLPVALEAGSQYSGRVVLRNEGAAPWPKGARVVPRLTRRVTGRAATGEIAGASDVALSDTGTEVPADVPPGGQLDITVPIALIGPDGRPVAAGSFMDNWCYELTYEVTAGGVSVFTNPASIQVLDADVGAAFFDDFTPDYLPGGRRLPVRLSVRNRGAQTWRKDAVRIGYHWYYQDGSEVIWEDETTELPADLAPGAASPEIVATVTAPPNDGIYWLVWDVRVGDTWASTMPSVRPFETRVHRVEIVRGKLGFVSLAGMCTADLSAVAGSPVGAGFDGRGSIFPAELLAPFADTPLCASGLWMPTTTSGSDSPRKLAYQWQPKDRPSAVVCKGQRIVLADPKKATPCRFVHIVAASVGTTITAGFTLVYADGSEQLMSFPIAGWQGKPTVGEEIVLSTNFTRTRSGERGGPGALYRYSIRAGEAKKLVAIVLPNAPDVRVVAVTLER